MPIANISRAERAPLFIPLLALWLYFLRFGYGYGSSDQGELLPAVLHRLNSELYAADWFVQSQAEAFNVRYYVVSLLEGMAHLMPLWLATALLYLTCWLAIAYALYAITYHFTRRPLASALAVGVGLVLTPQWTLGGNELVSSMFTPSMAAWALGLWALYLFLQRRPVGSALLLGVATWMQALVGLQLAGLCGLLLILRERAGWITVLQYGGTYLLAAAPLLVPLIMQRVGGAAPSVTDGTPESLFHIVAEFRNPHHYLFSDFPAESYWKFGLLVGLGLAAYLYERHADDLHDAAILVRTWTIIAFLCVIGYLLSEVYPVLFVTQLQLFKYTVLAKFFFVMCICGAVFAMIPSTHTEALQRLYDTRRAWAAGMLIVWLGGAAAVAAGIPAVHSKVDPLAHDGTPEAVVEYWIRSATHRDVVVAVPPSWSGFRFRARRAVVVDFKSFPFQPRLARAWYRRLTDIAPIGQTSEGGGAVLDDLDRAYARQGAATWDDWRRTYGVDYVVTRQYGPSDRQRPDAQTAQPQAHFRHTDSTSAGARSVFSAPPWAVYRLE